MIQNFYFYLKLYIKYTEMCMLYYLNMPMFCYVVVVVISMLMLSHIQPFCNAHQAPLSMGYS